MRIPESGPSLCQIIESGKIPVFDEETRKYSAEYNARYLHWDDLKYRDFGKSNRGDVWASMKIQRSLTLTRINVGRHTFSYNIPAEFLEILHDIDTNIRADSFFSETDGNRKTVLSESSVMEESISSSQLEGASTTVKLAKKMLRNNTSPENRSQQMIVNNYRAMQFIKENANMPLSPDLIKEIHRIVSFNTLEDKSFEGKFRTDDNIAVRDSYEDITYYVPIGYSEIDTALDDLCRYVNDGSVFVHPIVKGIILHFLLAYIHPFVDGNGRVSRSLFYWYALKNGYSVMEFLSISKAIKAHRQRYDSAYLKTEIDENDMTYFIRYNLEMISESIDIFSRYLKRKSREKKEIQKSMTRFGFNLRQSEILAYLVKSDESVTVTELATKFGATQTTVRRDLIKLVDSGYAVLSGKDGYRQLYRYSGKRIDRNFRFVHKIIRTEVPNRNIVCKCSTLNT